MSRPPSSLSETYTRIGVIGDIHTCADRLQWALDVLRQHAVERVFATGDIADGPHPEWVGRICELLASVRAVTVLGNHDRWLLDNQHRDVKEATFPEDIDQAARAFLQSLPASVELQTSAGMLLFGHGLGNNDMTRLNPYDHGPALSYNTTLQNILRSERYRYVVSGHTHLRMVREISGVKFINAGALHNTREPCCLLLDFTERRAQFFEHVEGGSFVLGPGHAL